MPEKSISDQIIDKFIEEIGISGILSKEHLQKLKHVLHSEKPKKADILKAIGGS